MKTQILPAARSRVPKCHPNCYLKKRALKRLGRSVVLVGTAAFAVTLLAAPKPKGGGGSHGTDILHYSVRKAMVIVGAEANAAGDVQAHQNAQGNANNQQLDLTVKGLAPSTSYQLWAGLGGDSNLTAVTLFTTDTNGGAALKYRNQGNGHGKTPLPDVLDPVSNVSELDVFNASTQAVLMADMTMPEQLQYLIKRDLSTNNVAALLRIQATSKKTQFSLIASGLGPTNIYYLLVNGDIVQTNIADAKGKLKITSLSYSGNILDLRALVLWDVSSNVVVSTTLP
jgi:hypothetical protein